MNAKNEERGEKGKGKREREEGVSIVHSALVYELRPKRWRERERESKEKGTTEEIAPSFVRPLITRFSLFLFVAHF